jgi:hypothetical protein
VRVRAMRIHFLDFSDVLRDHFLGLLAWRVGRRAFEVWEEMSM